MTTTDLTPLGRDPDAFEAFYRDHLDYVTGYVTRRSADPQTAADLVAEVFLRVVEGAETYRPGRGPVRAWLTGIARNVLADHVRHLARQRGAYGRLGGRRFLDEESTEALVARIDAQSSGRIVMRSVAGLPGTQREVVELVALDGLSLAEAASVLGITAGTARVRYHRARRALRAAHPTLRAEEALS
ncbi:MAG: RNA polymerase sigma factor [Nocardioides sp.]|uniref:RNA polymerase sigma factor n=1 Tax=Nocardioides sp. TaxID=35761 RepID=UPI003F02C11D